MLIKQGMKFIKAHDQAIQNQCSSSLNSSYSIQGIKSKVAAALRIFPPFSAPTTLPQDKTRKRTKLGIFTVQKWLKIRVLGVLAIGYQSIILAVSFALSDIGDYGKLREPHAVIGPRTSTKNPGPDGIFLANFTSIIHL